MRKVGQINSPYPKKERVLMIPEDGHEHIAVLKENVPEELQQLDQWVMWKKEYRDEKPTKVLYQANRRRAASTRASSWTTFDGAVDALGQDDFFDGVGFVFSPEDPYCGGDIDKATEEEARPWIDRFDSYTERSPSGEGFHIICKAKVPKGTNRDEGELYSSGRFFTMTGDIVRNKPVREAQDAADEFYAFLRRHEDESGEAGERTSEAASPPMTDAEVVRLAENAKNGHDFGVVYRGGGSFKSDSERDSSLAFRLAFWTQDEAQIERIMRGSGCVREKWDKHRTYLRDTIRNALSKVTEHYEPAPRDEEDARNESSDSFDRFDRFSEVFDFPVDAFPEAWANYIRAAAASLNCPPELVALPTLAAASGAIGRSKELLVKRRYSIPALLWLAVIAGAGEKKSPAQQLALLPSRDIQKDLRDDYREAKEDWAQEMREHTRDVKLARRNDEVEPPPPEKPTLRRILVDDITIEALALRLGENPRGFLSAQDELSGFLRGMDQYKSGGKGNARQQYLKIWSCGAITVDRKGDDEPIFIPEPFVTLQGGMQPSIVHEIADGRDDGFMDRFLFCYPPRHPGGLSEKGVPEDVEDAYTDLIRKLWEEGDDAPSTLGMTPEAKALFKSTSHKLAEERWQPGFPSMLDGTWGKMESQLGRLALILSCARHALEEKREVVSEDDMRRALKLIEYFKATARRVWGEVHGADPDEVLADRLITVLTESAYVYFGTISNLYALLHGKEAKKGEAERLGKAIRRIVRKNPATLSLEEHFTPTERKIKITYEKLSNPSNLSGEEQGQEDTSDHGASGHSNGSPHRDPTAWTEVF